METKKIEISPRTLFVILGVAVGLWLIWELRSVLIILFVAFILMSALIPTVERLQRRGFPRVLAILLPYLLFITVLATLFSFIIPPVIHESQQLIEQMAKSYQDFVGVMSAVFSSGEVRLPLDSLSAIPVKVVQVGVNTFNAVLGLVSIAVLTFYMLLERNRLYDHFLFLFPVEKKERVRNILRRIEDRLGAWVRGEFILMLTVGAGSWIGLSLLGVKYSLALAIIAGFLEIVPIIGPIISAVPAVLIALTVSPVLAGLTVFLYIIVQQLENHLLVPNVMNRTVNLDPLAIIVALMIGGKLMGFWGSLLAVPILAVVQIIVSDITTTSSEKS